MQHEKLTGEIINAGVEVHRQLGPGLFENVYQACLRHELLNRGLSVASEVPLAVRYQGLNLDMAYRIDLVVEDLVVVELKSIESFAPIHRAQLLTYLKLSGHPVGLLLNFNTRRLRDGIIRLVN